MKRWSISFFYAMCGKNVSSNKKEKHSKEKNNNNTW